MSQNSPSKQEIRAHVSVRIPSSALEQKEGWLKNISMGSFFYTEFISHGLWENSLGASGNSRMRFTG
jgi:hypothetical protein